MVGGGGREHALAWKLAQEAEVHVAPGNALIARELPCHAVGASDLAGIVSLAQRLAVDVVVVGPEDPLIAGLADVLMAAGLPCFGPSQAAAQLEGSKAFSKAIMREAGIPTADFGTFSDPAAARAFAIARFDAGRQIAVKASGAALGKGVVVCDSREQALDAIEMMMVDRELGEAGQTVVLEDRLVGREFSLLTLVGGGGYFSLPIAQDHKRALDGDRGPNTGGMGTYSPVDWVRPEWIAETEARMVEPLIAAMKAPGTPYSGVLFTGVMVDHDRPYCLEYNVRFGDPETQTVMARLGPGLSESLFAVARGHAPLPVATLDHAAITVVLASAGYPGAYQKGLPIELGAMPAGVQCFGAGVGEAEGQLITLGGRVLALTATGKTLAEARSLAYRAAEVVNFSGKMMRSDIAASSL